MGRRVLASAHGAVRTRRSSTPSSSTPRSRAATDGDDYIEGNGGDDTIFGNLGQDDIIGDSSDLYGLGDNQRVTLSYESQGVTTFYRDAAGNVVQWRVTGISADGKTLTLAGSARGHHGGQRASSPSYGPGVAEPIVGDDRPRRGRHRSP